MSSYVFTESHNFQTVLWAVAGATYRTVCIIRRLPTMGLAASLWVYALLIAVWPYVGLLCASSAKVAVIALAIGGAVAVVAALPVELFVGLAIVGVYGFVTFPRKAVG